MNLPLRSRKKAFTLIELLTVIAIIGVLAGMISVVVPLIRTRAAQLDAGNNCRQIALAYSSYASDSTPRNIPATVTTVRDWAVYLAQKTDMNTASAWFIPGEDKIAAQSDKTIPKQIINQATKQADVDFIALEPKAWEVVAAAPKNADGSIYPLLWTRGLEGNEWSKTDSPWNGKGGHIGYMNGNIAWVTDTEGEDKKGIFIDYQQKTQTPNVDSAIGPNARRLKK